MGRRQAGWSQRSLSLLLQIRSRCALANFGGHVNYASWDNHTYPVNQIRRRAASFARYRLLAAPVTFREKPAASRLSVRLS